MKMWMGICKELIYFGFMYDFSSDELIKKKVESVNSFI